jgi:hypothetical protein
MDTPYIESRQLRQTLERNEAFWNNRLEDYPLMWVTVPDAKPAPDLLEPDEEEKIWTDVDYVIASAENRLSRTYYAGDSLPVYNPWLGPDQFAGWLGAELTLKPKEFTSWSKPFVHDWSRHPNLCIDPANRWWKLYLEIVRASARAGRGKWVTAYPDLHSGIDALSAIRGPENLMMDMAENPQPIHRAMKQMTELWKYVVDVVSEIILPTGQGTSNWTMGWSRKRFLCIGQNDFSCLISPKMFTDFCWDDNLQCCDYVEHTLYHLDGPDALRHIPTLLKLDNLDAMQWVQGAGNPPPSKWIDLLNQIQKAGKAVQVLCGDSRDGKTDLFRELDILCDCLDPKKLFVWATAKSPDEADAVVKHAMKICRKRK